jgi:predicted Zn-dependent protease with MMP-like domain
MSITREEFEQLVAEALDGIPDEFQRHLGNVVVSVEEEPAESERRALTGGEGDLLGIYRGVPLPRREANFAGLPPDTIAIFRGPILRHCRSRDAIIRQIRDTVIHEVGHLFGFADDELP